MKRLLFSLFPILFLFGSIFSASAADIRHTYGGSSLNSFYIDNVGGSVNNGGSNNSYFLNLNDIDQSAFGTLFLYRNQGGSVAVDDGLVDEDFADQTGIQLFPLSVLVPGLAGEIGLADDLPLTPVAYLGNSGLQVEQVSYTSATPGDRFVIVEYRVVNSGPQAVQARIALSNDFDVDLKSNDILAAYDNTVVPMVYQQEGLPLDPNFTTVGVALLKGTEATHRLEVCSGPVGSCQIFANDGDLIRKAFFEGVPNQVGDLTGGIPNQDFAVTIAADLGTLQPGEGESVVFCYPIGQGSDAADALNECRNNALGCEAFYEDNLQECSNGLTNYGEECDDGNTNNHDDCPSGVGATCQEAECGDGFVWDEGSGTEECDDGNSSNNDACCNCRLAFCGDGFVWNTVGGTEECDDANGNNQDACTTLCELARCGDGFLRTGVEVCDDGNNNNGDGCAADCNSIETCGNGVVNPPFESCDDANTSNNDSCPNGLGGTCQPAFCGDGHVFNGPGGSEQCDDGNNVGGDGCSATCQNEGITPGGSTTPPGLNIPICGNGIVEGDEQCDDGNDSNIDGCNVDCEFQLTLQGAGGSGNNPGRLASGCFLNAAQTVDVETAWLGLLAVGLGLIWARLRKSPNPIK